MKYKLKENVTEEQLAECGFDMCEKFEATPTAESYIDTFFNEKMREFLALALAIEKLEEFKKYIVDELDEFDYYGDDALTFNHNDLKDKINSMIEGLKEKSNNLERLSVQGGYGQTNMPLLWQKSGVDYSINIVDQLNEPKAEECEFNYIDYVHSYDQDYDEKFYQCSNCEKTYLPNGFIDDFVYCPNCGRKIKKGEEVLKQLEGK